jgi:hypothetical protein
MKFVPQYLLPQLASTIKKKSKKFSKKLSKSFPKVVKKFVTSVNLTSKTRCNGAIIEKRYNGAIVEKVQWCNSKKSEWAE